MMSTGGISSGIVIFLPDVTDVIEKEINKILKCKNKNHKNKLKRELKFKINNKKINTEFTSTLVDLIRSE